MLVLTRKEGESIRIGDDVVITVCQLSGNKVRIGIEAPPECVILRGELDSHAERRPQPAGHPDGVR